MDKESLAVLNTKKLDYAIQKASQLVEILKEAERLISLLQTEDTERRIERMRQVVKNPVYELKSSQIIRDTAKAANVKLWQIAERLGTSDSYFSKMLRMGFSADKQAEILRIIAELEQELHQA